MERRRIRQEEEKEKERKKKELKRSFRKQKKDKAKSGFERVTVTKIVIIIAIIVTPIVIFFVWNYYSTERELNYSFLTEGDEVYGTLSTKNVLNFTHIITKIAVASTAQFINLDITDNYPYDSTLYQASSDSTFSSIFSIPYNLNPHFHHEGAGDCYATFTLLLLHNVPDILLSLRRDGGIIYPAVLEWNYRLDGTDLGEAPSYFFSPTITIEPGDMNLTQNTAEEIHVTLNLTAGYFKNLGFTEMSMTFTSDENITFSNPIVVTGALERTGNQYKFISRLSTVRYYHPIFLDFNITVNSSKTFQDQDILSSSQIFFQFYPDSLKNIYPTKGFGPLTASVLGVPDQKQLEAYIYIARISYTNFIIETPLIFDCT